MIRQEKQQRIIERGNVAEKLLETDAWELIEKWANTNIEWIGNVMKEGVKDQQLYWEYVGKAKMLATLKEYPKSLVKKRDTLISKTEKNDESIQES